MLGKRHQQLAIVVPTRNRRSILALTLPVLLAQADKYPGVQVVVVDNASSDDTWPYLQELGRQWSNLQLLTEKKIGSSAPRNTAIGATTAEYLLFLDDDARVRPDTMDRVRQHMQRPLFDITGGQFHPWYPLQAPPRWLRPEYVRMTLPRTEFGPVCDGYVAAGILLAKREVFEQAGNFSTGFGMRQGRMGYAEEDEWQDRARRRGYTIGFDPELAIDHLVMPAKYRLGWHFRATYAQERDSERRRPTRNNLTAVLLFGRSLLAIFLKWMPRATWRWLTERRFYVENWLLESFRPAVGSWGRLAATLARSRSRPV